MGFFTGTPARWEQRSTLGPEQRQLYDQLRNSAMSSGAGGAFGDSADYYRNLLGNDSEDFNAFAAPEMRRFQSETIPGLAEQFANMGAGGLSSSSFRNAAVNAGTDLSERLGAIRASLRQQAAQGLQNIGQAGLGNFNENIYHDAKPGFGDSIGSGIGTIAGSFGGPVAAAAGGAVGGALTNWLKSGGSAKPTSSSPIGRRDFLGGNSAQTFNVPRV